MTGIDRSTVRVRTKADAWCPYRKLWLVIAQGFGHHVAENAEALRHRLVRHQGRRELNTTAFDLSLASFEHAIARFLRTDPGSDRPRDA